MTHTKGQWKWDEIQNEHIAPKGIVVDDEGFIVCKDASLNNARLIAAAPELLEACKIALSALNQLREDDFVGVKWDLEEAIAKAEGK